MAKESVCCLHFWPEQSAVPKRRSQGLQWTSISNIDANIWTIWTLDVSMQIVVTFHLAYVLNLMYYFDDWLSKLYCSTVLANNDYTKNIWRVRVVPLSNQSCSHQWVPSWPGNNGLYWTLVVRLLTHSCLILYLKMGIQLSSRIRFCRVLMLDKWESYYLMFGKAHFWVSQLHIYLDFAI